MRVLIIHNYYQQSGGEDAVVAEEMALLRCNNVVVELFAKHNEDIAALPKAKVALDTLWSSQSADELAAQIARFKPDVIHSHNTFPLISPSIYYVAHKLDIPVVQTLHNFRLFCAQAMFMRNDSVCENCLSKLPWRAVVHACYRDSTIQSAAVVSMQLLHRVLGTYQHKVTRYIALNQFCSEKFIQAGLPRALMTIKPNFVDLPLGNEDTSPRKGALFVGRLSKEKGLATLAEAAIFNPQVNISVVGIGDEAKILNAIGNIQLIGWQTPDEIYSRMRRAAYLIMPSIWYENFPRTLVEAFACGLPVIASRLGAMAELIQEGFTGLLFEAGNAQALAEQILWADNHPEEMLAMGHQARKEYETKYSADINFKQLMGIYQDAIQAHRI